jgi:hypothetical protein
VFRDAEYRIAGQIRPQPTLARPRHVVEALEVLEMLVADERRVAKWLFITAAHTALHIGRIQLLRALAEGKRERAC